MQNSSYKNGETLVMGWCMQGVLFLRVQYQKIMTHLPQSIVCMAYRTGQTAVASIPRRAALSGLLGPLSVFAQSASDVSASGLRNGIGSYAGLLREARFCLSTSSLRRTSVLQSRRDVKRGNRVKEQELSTDDESSSDRLLHSHVSYWVLFLPGLLASHPCYPLFSLLSYRVVRVT